MRLKRFLIVALTCIVAWCGTGIEPGFAVYDMPYRIEVDLTNQIVTIYNAKDGTIARQMLCSAGVHGSTPTGTWYLPNKEIDTERTAWYYMKSYTTWVQYATRIFGLFFFHSIPCTGKGGSMKPTSVEKFGFPASHGCIRLLVEDAEFIARNCLPGTRVDIVKSGEKKADLRALLYVSSYSSDDGLSYQEYLGYAKDALGMGSTGTEVQELQLRLHDLGYFGGAINGQYEVDTLTAVKNLQKDLGLAQSGVTTVELKDVIFSDEAPVAVGQITLGEGSSGPAVKRFQETLAKLLLYEGDLDSVYDVDVVDAVKELQRMCGYPVDGVASPEIQHLALYEASRIEQELGEGYQIEKIAEDVTVGTVDFKKAKIIVRSQPDIKSAEVGKLSDGDQVIALAVEGDWAMIYVNGQRGFVYARFLSNPTTAQNYVIKYTSGDKSLSFGCTLEDMQEGKGSDVKTEFRNYYANTKYREYLDQKVEYVTVNTGDGNVRLKLRAEGSPDAEVITEVPNGTKLRALASNDEWTRVGYDDQIGYLMNQYLTFSEGKASEVEDTTDAILNYNIEDEEITAYVIPSSDNGKAPVYSDAGEVIGRLPGRCEVTVVEVDEDAGWVLIDYNGNRGYMRDETLSFRLGA